tara:strand:+ start:141 stop:269 length:129 start_codon:yes stop_codon:yes gene_type:complete
VEVVVQVLLMVPLKMVVAEVELEVIELQDVLHQVLQEVLQFP